MAHRWTLAIASTVLACGEPETLPDGTCAAVLWATAERDGVAPSIAGEWNDWATQPMRRHAAPWWVLELALPPGEYGYSVVQQGERELDPYNGLGGFRASDGAEVSWLVVDDCLQPRVEPRARAAGDPIELDFVATRDGDALDTAVLELDGEPFAASVTVDDDVATIPAPSLARGRHVLRARARDAAGREGPTAELVLWSEPIAERREDAIVYHVVVDRFRGDDGETLTPPVDPGARAGGTLDGVTAEIERGSFDALGISTLWLSPVYTNPVGARPGRDDDHVYEGYHGYWPADSRGVDPRIGGEAALDQLVATAHAHGLRVLLDLVPNHYDETNPRVLEHDGEGWFNHRDPPCICGASDCPWSSAIETCWFTPYLPDLRLQQRGALAAATGDALWWKDRFGIDGFRVDAVPMMPRAATRRIFHALREPGVDRHDVLLLGEVFTGAGDGGVADLRYHLGPDGLDSAFDFPTMWALRELLRGGAGFDALARLLADEDAALDGSGSVLARFLGNHDTTRIASALVGDDDGDPWEEPPPQSDDPELFAKLRLAFATVLTLPGVPVVYYGDELGLAGGRDPDSRRTMPGLDALAPVQRALFDEVGRLGRLRRCVPALRRGSWRVLGATADLFAFVREHDDGAVVVLLSRAAVATRATIPGTVAPGTYVDALSELRVELGADGATIELPAFAAVVLLPQGHACRGP